MSRKVLFFLVGILLLPAGALTEPASWMFPYVEAWTADTGPLSLPVAPDGGGPAFADAFTGLSQVRADASITLILYDDTPPYGEIVAGYPREDIWLMTAATTFASCPGGIIPDADTDQDGRTFWTSAPRAGGWFEPTPGNELQVWVTGWEVPAPGLSQLRFNSPDLSKDLVVNLVDVALFAQDYTGGYNFRSDLAWDGTIDLADLHLLAVHAGSACP